MRFDGFALPRALFDGPGLDSVVTDGAALFSVRPQSITLHRAAPPGDGRPVVAARLQERAFLGETWDYVVAPADSALRLKVAALPFQVFEAGTDVWLEFDPRQMAPVAG